MKQTGIVTTQVMRKKCGGTGCPALPFSFLAGPPRPPGESGLVRPSNIARPAQLSGIFVTGTDTGVGKTVVSAALLSILRDAGVDAVPMKPVQTGAMRRGVDWLAPDLEFCLSAAGLKLSQGEKRLMAPYCFAKPCSPHLAAALVRKRIRFERIANALEALLNAHDMVIVEGTGGLLVPIDAGKTMLDLIGSLKLPVVLVARPGLGTINHTLLSLRALKQARLPVLGVVINETSQSRRGEIEEDNIRTIRRIGKVRILGRLPFMPGLDPAANRKAFFRRCEKALPGVATLANLAGVK